MQEVLGSVAHPVAQKRRATDAVAQRGATKTACKREQAGRQEREALPQRRVSPANEFLFMPASNWYLALFSISETVLAS